MQLANSGDLTRRTLLTPSQRGGHDPLEMSALESCRRFHEPRAVPLGHTTELERGFLSGLKHQASVGVTLILPVRASHLCLREQILLKHISTPTGRGLPWPWCPPPALSAGRGGRTRGCSPLLCSFPPAVVARTRSSVGQGILRPFL